MQNNRKVLKMKRLLLPPIDIFVLATRILIQTMIETQAINIRPPYLTFQAYLYGQDHVVLAEDGVFIWLVIDRRKLFFVVGLARNR